MAATGEAGVWAYPLALGGYIVGLSAVIRRLLVLPKPTTPEDEGVERVRRFQSKYTLTFGMLAVASNVPPFLEGAVVASVQSPAAGERLKRGSEITVNFQP